MDYKTSDLNLAAFLKAKYNLKILKLEPDQLRNDRALFVFIIPDNIDVQQYITAYYNEEDLCSINSFMREQTDLRTWIKNYKINKTDG